MERSTWNQLMIRASDVPTIELARVIYLTAGALSSALRTRGAVNGYLYRAPPTSLGMWAGLTRGNLLALARLLLESIHESDVRRGRHNERGKLRFRAARDCLAVVFRCATLVPAGAMRGVPPLEI